MTKKKKVIIISVTVLLIIAFAVTGFALWKKFSKMKNAFGDMPSSGVELSGDMVSAYGVINIGTTEEKLDIDNMTTTLDIEEILFETGDTINEGDALVRFSAESVAEAETELKQNLRDAELAYRAGAIEYEQNIINAKYTYEATLLKGEQADAVYKETVKSLKSSLQDATDSYNESVELLAKYKDAQANDTYYEEYNLEFLEKNYEQNCDVLYTKMKEWEVSWSDITGRPADYRESVFAQYVYVLQELYEIIETNGREYEQALENYNNDKAELSYNLTSLQLNMSSLEETYLNAKKSYESSLLSAEETRQTSLTNAELAESEYNATVEKAKADYDSLQSAYEDAEEDYNTFTTCITDNTYHATNSGSIMRTMARANGSLSAGGRILTYSDTSDVTVSVSVDQADIAKLSVGDTAVCYASSTGMLNGTIVSISPVTASSSISSVNYSVTVKIDSDSNNISANTTVTVIFGSDLSSLNGMNLDGLNSGNSENGGMPDFENMDFGNMNFDNMPDFSNMGGERPNFGN